MSEIEKQSLTIHSGNGLARLGLQNGRIVAKMVEDVLSLSREALTVSQSAELTKKFKIGDYEWREPDYLQIILWAKVLNLEPEEVIRRLLCRKNDIQEILFIPEWCETIFEDGVMLRLHWDLDLLPILNFEWYEGLAITHLGFSSRPETAPKFSPCLPLLTHLFCGDIHLKELNLSAVPYLTILECNDNQLTELDLSGVPNLTSLVCCRNQLSSIDLTNLPMLENLDCSGNPLARLELSPVRKLSNLNCRHNRLTNLDLSCVPRLTHLWCSDNGLSSLAISKTPRLTDCSCDENHLKDIDLSAVPKLEWLNCSDNRLVKLDLSNIRELVMLDCAINQISKLDIRPLVKLDSLNYDDKKTKLIQRPDQNF